MCISRLVCCKVCEKILFFNVHCEYVDVCTWMFVMEGALCGFNLGERWNIYKTVLVVSINQLMNKKVLLVFVVC